MSNTPEFELNLDLHFLPDWAQQSSKVNPYTQYEQPHEGARPRRDRSDSSGPRRDRSRDRSDRPRTGGGPGSGSGPRPQGGGPRAGGQGGPGGSSGGGRRDRDRQSGGRGPRPVRREAPPLPNIRVTLVPEEKGVDSLSRQIRFTGRAYPMFDIAHLLLKKPERFHVQFQCQKAGSEGSAPSLWICNIDDSIWLSEQDAVNHILKKHFDTFYKTEKTPTDPPKGTYTFVAQCGMSGVILGPPNYHSYQKTLHNLHSQRFSRMPFDTFRARVKIVRDEEVVKKWLDEQSFKTEYECLNVPEPLKLNNLEEVEQHFRETHLANHLKSTDSYTLSNPSARESMPSPLHALVRRAFDEQKRFPLQIVTHLSQQFARHGLQFFKVNRTVTHVCVARPRYLDMDVTPVSPGVKKIVEVVNATPQCTRRTLLETLLPGVEISHDAVTAAATQTADSTPAAATQTSSEPVAPAASSAEPVQSSEAATEAPAESSTETTSGESAASAEGTPAPAAPAPEGETAPAPAPAPAPEPVTAHLPSPEQTTIITDLHWLIHQGHVIEFANGLLETAKKPAPKPTPAKKEAAPAPEGGEPAPASSETDSTESSTEASAPESPDAAASAPPAESPKTEPEPPTTSA